MASMANIVKEMKLSTSSQCVKYLMFVFNLIFVITGIILLSIGQIILGIYHDYRHFLDSKFFSVTTLLIAVGAIIFLIAFFGCCGAVRENYCMIITFTSLLVLVFILELTAGICGYVLRSRAYDVINEKMHDTMTYYNHTNPEIETVWDELQRDLRCCGTNNATDWLPILPNSTLPVSCCNFAPGTTGAVNCTLESDIVYKGGCFPRVLDFIKAHALQIGGVGLSIAFIQAIGIWFSIYLARSIRNTYETV